MTTTETATKTVRKRDSAGTRARILNVATREFANKGYEGAKTDSLACRYLIPDLWRHRAKRGRR